MADRAHAALRAGGPQAAIRRAARASNDGGPTHERQTNPTTTPVRARGGGIRRNAHACNKGNPTHGSQQRIDDGRPEDDDVPPPPATRTPTLAPTTMPTMTLRGVRSQGRPRRLTSTARGAYARDRPPGQQRRLRRLCRQGREARGNRHGRRGNTGLHKARTRGDRLRKRNDDATAMALRRRDGKVTATAAMVGARAAQQQRREGDATASKDNTCAKKPGALVPGLQPTPSIRASAPRPRWRDGNANIDATAMRPQRRCNHNGNATAPAAMVGATSDGG